MGRTFDQGEPPSPPGDRLRRLDRRPLALHLQSMENIRLGVKGKRAVEREMLTFVKHPTP